MQIAMPSELLLMSQCSQKKANAIIEARPFENWRDLVTKFQSTKYLDTELLNAAQVNLHTVHIYTTIFFHYKSLSLNRISL